MARAGLFFRAKRAKDGAAHDGFRRAPAHPDFPLGKPLGEKHFDSGNGGNPFVLGNPQKFRFLRPVDEVHNEIAVQLA